MTVSNLPSLRVERPIQRDSWRHEKGTAMGLIAEESKATESKTARLKALRLAREAAVVAEAPKLTPTKAKKRKSA